MRVENGLMTGEFRARLIAGIRVVMFIGFRNCADQCFCCSVAAVAVFMRLDLREWADQIPVFVVAVVVMGVDKVPGIALSVMRLGRAGEHFLLVSLGDGGQVENTGCGGDHQGSKA